MNEKGFSRRAVAIGGGIAAALGLTALGVTLPRLLRHRYRQTPYDDLLARLIDRDAAVKVGQAARIAEQADPAYNQTALVNNLRQTLDRRTLNEVTNADLAESKLLEVQGWVLPQTLVMLCVLAAEQDS